MALSSNKSDQLPNKLSRGRFLRDTVITASGIALFPSLLSSCTKDTMVPVSTPTPVGGGGLGATQSLSNADLEKAAANLTRMRAWITDLYPLTIEYELAVFELLDSTKSEVTGWSAFGGKVFIDILAGIAAAIGILNGPSLAIPAFALLGNILKDWGFGINAPADLAGTFGEFVIGHNRMQFAIEQRLSSLVDPRNNYENLRTWKDPIKFNDKSYTLQDLVKADFPGLGDHYNKLQTDAYTHFKKAIWNLVIMKCCTYYENFHDLAQNIPIQYPAFLNYAVKFYSENKGVYLRGIPGEPDADNNMDVELIYYNLGINGYPLPDKAAAVLFIDDTPGRVINPEGLWNRSYVFKQFSKTKPQFKGKQLADISEAANFTDSDDWQFTGGLFPELAK